MERPTRCSYFLKIYITDSSEELKDKYKDAISQHNAMVETSNHPDSGFDLFTPLTTIHDINEEIQQCHFRNRSSVTVKGNMKAKTAMFKVTDCSEDGSVVFRPTGFFLYPRSSISKTNVRLANNTGIIDSGYRGCLAGMFDILRRELDSNEDSATVNTLDNYHRLLQICAPGLEPFRVELVFDESDLGVTSRGAGGFGSTGTS